MKGTAKWLFVILGVVLWASCTQLTNFDMPEQDTTVDPPADDGGDPVAEDGRVDDVPIEEGGPDCGNGTREGTEECDDGNNVDGDGCQADCTYTCTDDAGCRDTEICNGVETCNTTTHDCDPGTAQADGFVCLDDPRSICLSGACGESTCGDGYIDTGAGEFCEPPGEGSCTATCTFTCTTDTECPDDTNMCNGDEYCNTTAHECQRQDVPADGTVCVADPRQICIGGNCQNSICGDSFTDTGATPVEDCDDGNTLPDDGCENDCTFTCTVPGDCDDGLVCNGAETCNTTSHLCEAGTNADSGTPCNDNLYCTVTDTCDGAGACGGTGDPCVDALDCTTGELCVEATDSCTYTISSDQCLIGGACIADATANPANECQACISATSQTDWSNVVDDTPCTADALACTDDVCFTGACTHLVTTGNCLISGTCYTDGTINTANECQECDNDGTSPDNAIDWSSVADDVPCTSDGLTCTDDVCLGGTCSHPVDTGGTECLIDSTCYADGAVNAVTGCQECDTATSRTAWTNLPDDTACTVGGGTHCISGACVP